MNRPANPQSLARLLRGAALSPFVLGFAIAAIALAAGLHFAPRPPAEPPAAKPVLHRPVLVKRIAAAKPMAKPAPPTLSAYAVESTMNPRELIDRWTPFIQEAARRFHISGQWIRAVMMIESGGRTMLDEGRPIVSTAGAMGLMQLMPETWREMRAANRLGNDPFDPRDNIIAGTAYLSILYRQYGYPTMFAAYNDGPGMLEAHRALSQPLPVETANYVRDIASILSTGVRHRPGSTRDLARLTRPDGTAVMIDAGAVVSVRAALPGEYAPGVRAVIAIGRLRQGVRETAAAATAVIRSHGGLI